MKEKIYNESEKSIWRWSYWWNIS